MQNNSISCRIFVVAVFLAIQSAVWADTWSALTIKNGTAIRISVTATMGGSFSGGGLVDPGQTISEGLPMIGSQNLIVQVNSGVTLAGCSAVVNTAMGVLVSVTGSTGTYSCSIQNDTSAPILNTNMQNYSSQTVTIMQNMSQDGKSLTAPTVQVDPSKVVVVPTPLRSTTPVTIHDQIMGTKGNKVIATCSGTITFNVNSFYTSVRVVSDPQAKSGISCTIW